jgi:Xaa-Pro aminopeptidase
MSISTIENLKKAEAHALRLFDDIVARDIISSGRYESEVNEEILELAKIKFGVKKYWHKRIVRAGENTLHPYSINPPDLIIQDNDIVFLDFGPIFEDYEADIGRTYVLGDNASKLKLKNDVEHAWFIARDYLLSNRDITCSEFYRYCQKLAGNCGWHFGGEIAGHVIGQFPHMNIGPAKYHSYLHPENHNKIFSPETPHWIIEIHFVDRDQKIGGFFEQLAI